MTLEKGGRQGITISALDSFLDCVCARARVCMSASMGGGGGGG